MEIKLESPKLLVIPEDPEIAVQGMLYFLDGQYLFRYRTERGMQSKFVTAPDLAAAFSQSEQDTGWLQAGIVRCGSSSKGHWFVYSAPAQKIKVVIIDQALTIPIPRTVLFGIDDHYYLWAIKEKYFEPDAEIYQAPFPNVYSDGKICWGQNTPPKAEATKARTIWEMFFRTPFNNDLANQKSRLNPNSINDTLKAIAGKHVYPLADLVEVNRSVGQAIEYLLEER